MINTSPNRFITPERLGEDYEARDVGTQGVHLKNSVLLPGALNFHDSDNYMQIIPKQYLSSGCEM